MICHFKFLQDSDTNDDLYVYTYKGFGQISSREDYEADLPKSFYQVKPVQDLELLSGKTSYRPRVVVGIVNR